MAENNGEIIHDILNATMGEGMPEFLSLLISYPATKTALDLYQKGAFFTEGNVRASVFAILGTAIAAGAIYLGFLRGDYFRRVYGRNIDPLKIAYEKIKSIF